MTGRNIYLRYSYVYRIFPDMRIDGTCYIGSTLSKQPGRRWVIVGWTDDSERCLMASLPERPNTPLTSVCGDEARLVRSRELQEAVNGGVLVVAGSLGGPAVGLVIRGLLDDKGTKPPVREMLSRRS